MLCRSMAGLHADDNGRLRGERYRGGMHMHMRWQLTADKGDGLVEWCPPRAGAFCREIRIPDRHATEENERIRRLHDLCDGLANLRPRHLRATVQAFGAEQQHDGLQIHAEVGPLGATQVAVDVAEQGGRCAETV